jgi:hypothetical protein
MDRPARPDPMIRMSLWIVRVWCDGCLEEWRSVSPGQRLDASWRGWMGCGERKDEMDSLAIRRRRGRSMIVLLLICVFGAFVFNVELLILMGDG